MSLTIYSFTQFKQLMATRMSAIAKLPPNTDPGSSLGAIFDAESLMGLSIQGEISYINTIARLASIPSNADGTPNPDIDSFVNPFGVYRIGPGASSGQVTLATASPVAGGPLIVPVGGQLVTNTGLVFQIIADPNNIYFNAGDNGYPIANGDTTTFVSVVCLTTGTLGNVLAGQIDQFSNGIGIPTITGISTVSNALAFTNGLNNESDASLKVRFTLQVSTGVVGTANALLAAASAVEAALTVSLGDRVNADLSVHPAYFTVFVNLLGQNTGPGAPLLSAVRSALELKKAVGISFQALGPTLVPVNAAGTIIPTADAPTTLVADVNAAYTIYANSIGLDPGISDTIMPLSRTYAKLQAVPGVSYIDGLVFNSYSTSDQVAHFGSELVAGVAAFHT